MMPTLLFHGFSTCWGQKLIPPWLGPLPKSPNNSRARGSYCFPRQEGCYQRNTARTGGNTGPFIQVISLSSKQGIALHTLKVKSQ